MPGDDLPYVIQWLCNRLEKLCLLSDSDLLPVFEQSLLEISASFDCDECLLLLQGCLSNSSNVEYFIRILKAVSVCATKIDFKHFGRFKGVFISCESLLKNLPYSELLCALNASADLFGNLISPAKSKLLNSTDKSFLQHHTLFMISMLPYNDSQDTEIVLTRFISNLSNIGVGLYTLYLSCRKLLLTSPDMVLYGRTAASVIVPSWIRLLHYFFTSSTHELYRFWPLVFTDDYWIDLICLLVDFLLDRSKRNLLLDNCKVSLVDSKNQAFNSDRYSKLRRFTLHFIQSLFKKYSCSLHRVWWNPDRFKLLECLEIVATEPVSDASLPEYITEAVGCIEQIISSSTYLARFCIYAKLLEPIQDNIHHGWRGHVVTLFKNNLHNLIMQTVKDFEGYSEVTDPENSVNTCYSEEVRRIFKYIFRYPLPFNSQENLIDESSWLLSALNLALYIFMTFKSNPSSPVIYIVELLTNNTDGKLSYFCEFMYNLKSCLDQRIVQCQAGISALQVTLSNTDDTTKISTLTSKLGVQESIMLRLRLLEMTLHQTEKYLPFKLTSSV
ncbi:unnamed protein product [Schistosoma turkestanicum]|nr:unnamed protein product [Schistosoma turkestanicum]